MSVSKRLFQYAMKVKGTIFAAMLMLFIFVIAELAGPFVAKTMIDDHIVGQKRVKRLFRIMAPFIREVIASRKVRKKEKKYA